MLKAELLDDAKGGDYCFCATRECQVVYFGGRGSRAFTTGDLRVRLGVKARHDPIPLCYCFGFDESHVRDEIRLTGATTVGEKISRLVGEGLCACETRNPAGVCCLREVNLAVKRLAASLTRGDGRTRER